MIDLKDILNNFDGTTAINAGLTALGATLSAVCYFANQRQNKKAQKIEDAIPLAINNDLEKLVKETTYSVLPYVAVSGYVNTKSTPLFSHVNHKREGVIWNKTITEHKEVWGNYAHNWKDNVKEISNVVDFVPFYLSQHQVPNGGVKVNVIDPLESKWTMDSLDIVHEEFRPNTHSLWDRLFGYLSGDRVKGYTDTEKMLTLGTHLYGIGEMVYEDQILKLKKPTSSNAGDYIITTLTPEQVKQKFLSYAKLYRVLGLLLGTATAFALYYCVNRWWKNYQRSLLLKKENEDLDEVKERRMGNADKIQLSEDNTCIICWTNPRECVLLNCGHVALCVDCYRTLPKPKKCPMCRENIVKTVPLFHA